MNQQLHKNPPNLELPLELNISFQKILEFFEKYAKNSFKNNPLHETAKNMLTIFEAIPELKNGFSDYSLLEKYQKEIDLILDPLFPEPLLVNEIKAASIPFSFTSFKYSTRFKNILQNSGNYTLNVRNLESESLYIRACIFILSVVYHKKVDIKRPFYFDIPDKTTGTMKYYRAAFNADFSEVIPTENAPKLTEEDFKNLLNNFDKIEVWKEKFPPNSYIFKGFVIINLFDVTAEEMVSTIKANLLSGGEDLTVKLEDNIRDFYGIKDLKLGYAIYDNVNTNACETVIKKSNSIVLNKDQEISCESGFFCNHIVNKVFKNNETIAISDVEEYGKNNNKNEFYKNLITAGIQSIVLIPIKTPNNDDLALFEIASPRAYELNSVNINKLKDIIPVFEAAVKRSSEERQNILEATIQENYTSIHNSVKWRFYEAAEKYHLEKSRNENAKLDEIIFDNVYPLYGQSDIKGSSLARSIAIREDLITQLNLAISVLDDACSSEKLSIYRELKFRVSTYLNKVKVGLNAGDEISILEFLTKDIYPVFNHLKQLNSSLATKVNVYVNRLDKNLNIVYEKRRDYEESVMHLNDKLANFLDKKQKEAQDMFPHYFERYKTDGVEYNLYIGQSITKEKTFNNLYLHNLRLWQLQVTCEMENLAYHERKNLKNDLRVASLILVHSNAMAIKFRMDEKQFDVDGAYNIRYEIIKKRIDKALIKGTNERLTVPGKIAIVYSQEKDAREYLKYIKYMQSKKQLGAVEELVLEDLQGVSGLKALRVEVLYQNDFQDKKSITFDDLIQEIEA